MGKKLGQKKCPCFGWSGEGPGGRVVASTPSSLRYTNDTRRFSVSLKHPSAERDCAKQRAAFAVSPHFLPNAVGVRSCIEGPSSHLAEPPRSAFSSQQGQAPCTAGGGQNCPFIRRRAPMGVSFTQQQKEVDIHSKRNCPERATGSRRRRSQESSGEPDHGFRL